MALDRVSVQLHTKAHIKAYLTNNFGEKPLIGSTHIFHNYLLLCYSHTLTLNMDEMGQNTIPMVIYITPSDYRNYGCWLNARQMHFFNQHVDEYMKSLLVAYIDSYMDLHKSPRIKDAAAYALKRLNISEDDWEWDTIKKYYYRHRLRNDKPILYNRKK